MWVTKDIPAEKVTWRFNMTLAGCLLRPLSTCTILPSCHPNALKELLSCNELTIQPACGSIFCLQRGRRRVSADIWKAPKLILGSCVYLLVWKKKKQFTSLYSCLLELKKRLVYFNCLTYNEGSVTCCGAIGAFVSAFFRLRWNHKSLHVLYRNKDLNMETPCTKVSFNHRKLTNKTLENNRKHTLSFLVKVTAIKQKMQFLNMLYFHCCKKKCIYVHTMYAQRGL